MRTFLLLSAAILASTAASADEDAMLAKLNAEAKVFFAQVLKDREQPIETCEFEPDWSDYPISYEDAHAFLGLQVYANLQNIDGVQKPTELLVAAGASKEAICKDDARDRYVKSRLDALRATFKPNGRPQGFYSYKIAYSFPAFDADFKRAMVVEAGSGFPNFLDEKGVPKRSSISGSAVAYTYQRDARGWHKVDTIEMANWD